MECHLVFTLFVVSKDLYKNQGKQTLFSSLRMVFTNFLAFPRLRSFKSMHSFHHLTTSNALSYEKVFQYDHCLNSFFLCCLADLIFLIYVYQRWIYPVDKKRVNEFGFGGEDDQAVDAVTDAAKEEEKKTN